MLNVSSHRSQGGLTLIELMVTVAIIAILAAVAWNFYDDQAAKNRRTDVIIALSQARLAMQQWKSDFGAFDANGNAAGAAALNAYRANAPGSAAGSQSTDCLHNRGYMASAGGFVSCRGYYTITVAATPETYTLTATPPAGSIQFTDDPRCRTYTLTNTGVRGVDITGVKTGLTGGETIQARTRECWAE
jgi:type IV pilus assembly protein PilE